MLKRVQHDKSDTYIITESVFSMDGDSPDLEKLIKLAKTQNTHLIIDEAHALGVFEKGLVQKLGLENDVFVRVITFGKALGCHGAVVLGSQDLKDYLVNFSRSFIYTTALPPQALANIKIAYNELTTTNEIYQLKENISFFKKEVKRIGFQKRFLDSDSAIQCCILPGNEKVKSVASILQDHGFDVKPILSPTVPKGKERLRFCIHSYNSKEEISEVLTLLVTFANQ